MHKLIILIASLILCCNVACPSIHAEPNGFAKGLYHLPAQPKLQSFTFAGVRIPFEKTDVQLRVRDQLNYLLMDQRAIVMDVISKMHVYGPAMVKILEDEKCPQDLIYVAGLLGRFSPTHKTKTGGLGWWALGPLKEKNGGSTQWISTQDWDDRRDPVTSTKIAAGVFSSISKRSGIPDWLFACCAYVDGIDKIEAVTAKNKGFGYWDVVLPHYSEVFVPQLIALKLIFTHLDFYGIDVDKSISWNHDILEKLKINKDIPLHTIAKLTGTPVISIWELNPGVDVNSGVMLSNDKKNQSGNFLRVPKSTGGKVREALIRNGYISD